MQFGKRLLLVVGILSAFALVQAAQAASYGVDVGYADNLRPSPFFPNPWQGDPNTIFLGHIGGSFDSGAIKINNTDSVAWTLDAVSVDGFGDGTVYAIWGASFPLVVNPGESVILAETANFNFDSSDNQGGGPDTAVPVVHVTIDGVAQAFGDTAQVLNTEGTDHLAAAGLNESHDWRPIGTFGGQAGANAPLPSTAWTGVIILAGLGLSRFVGRRKLAAV